MTKYGILKDSTNTGADNELHYVFSTPLSVISNQPAYVQDSLNLKRSASSQNVQRWEITANIAQDSTPATFMVHSVYYGHHTSFLLRMPQPMGIKLTNNVGLTTKSGVTYHAGLDSFAVEQQVPFAVGEFISFSTDPKVYVVTSSGPLGTSIYPRLRKDLLNATIFCGTRVTMRARYNTDVRLGIVYVDGIVNDQGSVTCIEALE